MAPGFANPGDLLKQLSDAAGTSAAGAEFAADGPHQRVSASGTNAVFTPAGGADLADMAYATYHLNLAGLALEDRIDCVWAAAPEAGALWLGLSDWYNGSWKWLKPAQSNALAVPDLAGYVGRDGDLLLVIMLAQVGTAQLSSLAISGVPAEDWSQAGQNAQHTGQSPFNGPASGELKWTFETTGPGFMVYQAARGQDGTLYFGAGPWLHAVNPDGTRKWRIPADDYITHSVSIGPDGTIYFLNGYGKLSAASVSGDIQWSYKATGTYLSIPTIGEDGTIYIGDGNHNLLALNADGSLRWTVALEDDIQSMPAVSADGSLILACTDRYLYGFNPDGTQAWQVYSGMVDSKPPVAAADGTIYLNDSGSIDAYAPDGTVKWSQWLNGSGNDGMPVAGPDSTVYVHSKGRLQAFSSSGEEVWKVAEEEDTNARFGTPAVLSDGSIMAGCIANGQYYLYRISSNGTVQWKNSTTLYFGYPCSVGSDDTVYFGVNGRLTAVSPQGYTKWTYLTGGAIESAPVLGPDGTLYFGSKDQRVYALNPDGSQAWAYTTRSPVSSSPVVGRDGCVYANAGGYIYAINRDGSIRWTQEAIGGGGLLLAPDGTLYLSGYYLYALDSFGNVLWKTQPEAGAACALGFDGTLYLRCSDGIVKAINPDGSEKWVHDLGSEIRTNPVVAPDGSVYIGCWDSCLHAVTPEGTANWSFDTSGIITMQPAIGPDGTVYLSTAWPWYTFDALFAVDPSGTEKWRVLGSFGYSDIVVSAEGNIHVCDDTGTLHAFSQTGQQLWSADFPRSGLFSWLTLARDGTVYVASDDGQLFAVGD